MVHPNEIMLGNCFQMEGRGIFKWGSDWYGVVTHRLDLEKVQPIPLSKDIIENSGFEFIGYGGNANYLRYRSGHIEIAIEEHPYIYDVFVALFCYKEYEDGKKHYRVFKHVHEFQNFYYSIAKQELKINIP